MQGGAGDPLTLGSAVQRVTKQGEAESCRMGTNLVSSTRHGLGFKEDVIMQASQNAKDRARRLAFASIHGGPMAVTDIGTKRQVGGGLLPGGISLGQSMIGLDRLMFLELKAELAMGIGVSGKNQNAARDLVEAMNDPEFAKVSFQ